MKLFKNKFFLIALCVAVVLCAVPTTFSVLGYRELSRNIVGVVTYPFRWCVTAVGNGISGFGRYFTSIDRLNEENESLREENDSLQDRVERAELLEKENERLRAYLEMKQNYPSFVMEEGMVIGRSSDNVETSFTVNRGSLHGIEEKMPVVTKDGIVGYVAEVGLNFCTVKTLIETASTVGAYIPRTGATGFVKGDHALRYDGMCEFSEIDASFEVEVGDKVYSTGLGSVYPADLPIGVVTEVTVDEYSRTKTAKVEPFVNLEELQYLIIITGYEKETP